MGIFFQSGNSLSTGNSLSIWEFSFNLGTLFQPGNSLSTWEFSFNLGILFQPGNSLSTWEFSFNPESNTYQISLLAASDKALIWNSESRSSASFSHFSRSISDTSTTVTLVLIPAFLASFIKSSTAL
jgi:hypothetical protein